VHSGVSGIETVLQRFDDADRDTLRQVSKDLGIEPTDALWTVLAALEYRRKR
jgi:hypothetical protein